MKLLKGILIVGAIAGAGYLAYTRYSKKYLIGQILKKSELENTPENRAKLEDSTAKELRQTLSFY